MTPKPHASSSLHGYKWQTPLFPYLIIVLIIAAVIPTTSAVLPATSGAHGDGGRKGRRRGVAGKGRGGLKGWGLRGSRRLLLVGFFFPGSGGVKKMAEEVGLDLNLFSGSRHALQLKLSTDASSSRPGFRLQNASPCADLSPGTVKRKKPCDARSPPPLFRSWVDPVVCS